MNILLIGSAAENTATALLLRRSKDRDTKIFIWGGKLPSDIHSLELSLPPTSTISQVVKTAVEVNIDLVILTTESAILSGIANALQSYKIPCFGPTRVASHFRWEPKYAAQVIKSLGIPSTTDSVHYNLNNLTEAVMAITLLEGGIALRAVRNDGRVQHFNCETVTDIANAIYMLETQPDLSSYTRFYLERLVHGVRCKYVAMVCGRTVVPIGSVSELRNRITSSIAEPFVRELNRDESAYTGWLVMDLVMNRDKFYVGEMSCMPSAEYINGLTATPDFDFFDHIEMLMQNLNGGDVDHSVEIFSGIPVPL